MAKRVRRKSLDEVQRREVLAILAVGGSRQTAAQYVQCDVEAIRYTASRNADFRARLKKAEASPEFIHLKNIQSAGEKNWRASAWLLERMYPQRYRLRKSDGLTLEQAVELLKELTDFVVQEIPVAKYRERILERLEEMLAGLRDDVEGADDAP